MSSLRAIESPSEIILLNCMDHFSTRSIHVASDPDELTGAVVPNLSVATTFRQKGVNKHLVSRAKVGEGLTISRDMTIRGLRTQLEML